MPSTIAAERITAATARDGVTARSAARSAVAPRRTLARAGRPTSEASRSSPRPAASAAAATARPISTSAPPSSRERAIARARADAPAGARPTAPLPASIGGHHPSANIASRSCLSTHGSGWHRFPWRAAAHSIGSGHEKRTTLEAREGFFHAPIAAPGRSLLLVSSVAGRQQQARQLPTQTQTLRTNGTHFPSRQDPQHRDHGAHRRREDDDDRAHPLLHRPHAQDGRGPRGRRGHGLDGAGAGAGV